MLPRHVLQIVVVPWFKLSIVQGKLVIGWGMKPKCFEKLKKHMGTCFWNTVYKNWATQHVVSSNWGANQAGRCIDIVHKHRRERGGRRYRKKYNSILAHELTDTPLLIPG